MKVLITGSSRGIGRAITEELHGRGHHVVATARKLDSIADVPATERYALDVTDEQSIKSVAAAVDGPLDVLVNAAGAPLVSCPIEHHPLSDLREQLEVNYLGTVRMIQAFVGAMRARGNGLIVNIGSITGKVAQPLRGAANASKFALEGVCEALHYELGHFGVEVTLVEPGATENQPGKVKYALRDAAPDYLPLFDQFDRAEAGLTASVPKQTPAHVATAVGDLLDTPAGTRPLRLQLGGDADKVMAVRRVADDVEFERQMRELLGITW
jgi:NAD(P)-dependent dehydrogenase (short-subunit alcohol dehydrogenase family)